MSVTCTKKVEQFPLSLITMVLIIFQWKNIYLLLLDNPIRKNIRKCVWTRSFQMKLIQDLLCQIILKLINFLNIINNWVLKKMEHSNVSLEFKILMKQKNFLFFIRSCSFFLNKTHVFFRNHQSLSNIYSIKLHNLVRPLEHHLLILMQKHDK